jgi:hypothetical protein
MKFKRLSIAIVALFIVFGGLLIWYILTGNPTNDPAASGKIRIKDYHQAEVSCMALMPACGYCPGVVVNKNCYVTQAEFDKYKSYYSELKADNWRQIYKNLI